MVAPPPTVARHADTGSHLSEAAAIFEAVRAYLSEPEQGRGGTSL